MGASSRHRIKLPDDLQEFARPSDGKLSPAEPHSGVVHVDSVPWLEATYDELVGLPLNSRHGFLLSLVDGRCSVGMLADIAGFDRFETVALIAELVGLGAVTLRDP